MSKAKGPQGEWIDTVLKKGTIADQLAAHILLVHESRDWKSLNTLIEMVDPKKCRRRCVMAMSTLKELFLESLNINKKNCQITSDEEKQKVRFYYTKFIDQLNRVAFDNLEETRRKAILTLSELLAKFNENKEYILEKLINKLGDNVPKLATSAGQLIEKAVNSEREEIRKRAIKYIQKFLSRPNQSVQARYYAISLLSRLKLIKGNHDMANDLMQTYLDLYIAMTKEKKIDSKLMSTILVGIHRAYPYSKLKNDVFEQHLQTLYTLVHQVNFRMRVIAMVLIKNIVTKRAQLLKCPVEDRFYNLIFGQLIESDLPSCSRQQAFVNLLLTVINEDPVLERKEAFIKRMLQVALNSPPDLAQLLLSTIARVKGYNTDLCVGSREDDETHQDDDDDDEDDNISKRRTQVDQDDCGSASGSDSADEGSTEGNPVVVGSSWVHKRRKTSKGCDLLARNPRGARPDHLNELYLLRRCYDPAVAGAAQKLMKD